MTGTILYISGQYYQLYYMALVSLSISFPNVPVPYLNSNTYSSDVENGGASMTDVLENK